MIGKSLKEIRDDRNLTALDIAEQMDCTVHTVNKWLSDVNNPTLEDLDKLANYLRVSVDYLMGRTECSEAYSENAKIRMSDREIQMVMRSREIKATQLLDIEDYLQFKWDKNNKRD